MLSNFKWSNKSVTLRPNSPPNSSNHDLLSCELFIFDIGPPYSFCEFSPQKIYGILNLHAIFTGVVKIPTCSGQEISPNSKSPILFNLLFNAWF